MTEDFHIRPATTADRGAVTALFRRAYPDLLPEFYTAATLRAALPFITTAQPALLECGTYYLAQDEQGRVVGAGGWTDVSPARGVAAPGVGHLRHVAVHPCFLRRGLARRVVECALDSARAFGVARMNCMSTLAARAFYAEMGFSALGEVELTLAPGVHFPAIQMQREL
ncbi:GNAT family N-acetyltransferase [Shimia sp.]|uniref:GNAT family N-acetyltransferase n=1 Tax=Shimia sp. TaxID=1954381 RepID=UPI003569385B